MKSALGIFLVSLVLLALLSTHQAEAVDCGTCTSNDICTAIGCINVTTTSEFITTLRNFVLGIAGGIALLLIIVGGIMVLTSSGNPKQLKSGTQLIASAIAGLLIIIFAVFILRIIGAEILQIPEFKTAP